MNGPDATYCPDIEPRPTRARGFTLIESLMAVLIVSGVLVAALGTFGAIGRARQIQIERAQAFGLAEQVMAEVVQSQFQEPSGATTLGPDAGETTRALYDDVDDFNMWSASPPQARDGTALAGYTGWTVRVSVQNVTPTAPNTDNVADVGLKRIMVQVKTPSRVKHRLEALRARGGSYEQTPSQAANYLTWGGVAVKVGEGGRTVYGGAHPLNVTTNQP